MWAMSHGPTLLFDKSAIQRYSKDEAGWLTHFFRGVIAPVFLIEVRGNLAKTFKRGDAASMVSSLAAKARDLGCMHNVSHYELIENEILGTPVEMSKRPLVAGGKTVVDANGERGIFFDISPEDKMLMRWEDREFSEPEREHAARFRKRAKEDKSLEEMVRETSKLRRKDVQYAQNLNDLLAVVDLFLDNPKSQYRTLRTVLEAFDQERSMSHVYKHWVAYGRPPIKYFLPYSYFCLRITMTFLHAVGLGIIGQRPTNLIDLQYLYYLPFCRVFVSADQLHHDLAPLFMDEDQRYVPSDAMHDALRALCAHYDALSEEEKRTGTMNYAEYPPLGMNTLVHTLYDDMMPGWRQHAVEPRVPITPEENARIMKRLRPIIDAIERSNQANG